MKQGGVNMELKILILKTFVWIKQQYYTYVTTHGSKFANIYSIKNRLKPWVSKLNFLNTYKLRNTCQCQGTHKETER
jgi:hypothetical protein